MILVLFITAADFKDFDKMMVFDQIVYNLIGLRVIRVGVAKK